MLLNEFDYFEQNLETLQESFPNFRSFKAFVGRHEDELPPNFQPRDVVALKKKVWNERYACQGRQAQGEKKLGCEGKIAPQND